MAMKRLAIIGSGDLGEQIAWHATNDNQYQVVGFFDDFAEMGVAKHGLPVLGKVADVRTSYANGVFDELLLAIGYKHFEQRMHIFDSLKNEIPFGRLIHSSAYVDDSVKLGRGVVIYPGCVVDMKSHLHDNVLLNAGVVVAHDTTIGSHSFLSPGVKVAGFVRVGNCVSLGIGTAVVDNLTIADYSRTGAGAVVIESITDPGLYVGVPARYKKP
jgi:sugar O-acyltransferase (sialic acid O-acetyltransferase NeuD family)